MSAAPKPSPRNRPRRVLLLLWLALPLVAAGPVAAQDLQLHGRLALTDLGAFNADDSLDAALGYQYRNDFLGDLRLTWEHAWESWKFDFHYVVSGDAGGGIALANAAAPFYPTPPPATWLDLTWNLLQTPHTRITHRIDRLSLTYTTPHLVARVGRQALTWGSGMVFHPMDLVDPFAPNATDTEYKPGVDMAYLQWLFDDGSDVQAIAVPRPAVAGGPLTLDASSGAVHYHRAIGELQTTWLAARDHGDWVAGAGVSGTLGGALLNVEVVSTFEAAAAIKTSALANLSGATTLFGRNATVFAEYFHNGFGVASGATLDALPFDLSDRLARGQVFNVGRDYLAGGMTVEWTPVFTVSPTLVVNLTDGSFDAAFRADWSINDNLDLTVGGDIPIGRDGTEYGGLETTSGSGIYTAPPATAYVQLRQYF